MTGNDTRFFTNEPGRSLLERFKKTLKDVQFFDVLVGYFQTSGFHQLHEDFENIEKIRILVGLGIDKQAFEIIEEARGQMALNFTHRETQDLFSRNVVEEIEQAQDLSEVELSIRRFIQFLTSKKIEIKAHPSQKIHAKVYISRFTEGDRDFGRVITGSSNFSYSGLEGQHEFNVELKDKPDVQFALDRFEELWKEAIDVNEDYITSVNAHTWLNDKLSPYELFLKTLYEYFQEDINLDQTYHVDLPEGFLELEYQKQATLAAYKILEAYNGVFLSDVVGLGKTYISALLAQQLDGGKLILCPPPLKEYWEETFRDFGIRRYKVESIGKIDQVARMDLTKYPYIFLDEAHRFRNDKTQTYAQIAQICAGKKVVLVTATPFNNALDDLLSQLKLFQAPRKSLIPGVSDLDKYFRKSKRRLGAHTKGSPEYFAELEKISSDIREHILKYVMVRRVRNEIVQYFQTDLDQQGLSFPEIAPPHSLTYPLDEELENAFDKTIETLQTFAYARYIPLLYLKRSLSPLEEQQQKNVRAFMKILLVKRLESSFHAFKNTIGRFVGSYQRYIEMLDAGTVYISKKIDVFDYLDTDREDELLELVESEDAIKIASADFAPEYRQTLERDLSILKNIDSLWRGIGADPKLDAFVEQLRNNQLLKDKKLIIFTEAAETGEYLYDRLASISGLEEVIFARSGGGRYKGQSMHTEQIKQIVRANFDPMAEDHSNSVRILVTTDVLSEGVNLHRANTVINYDLPWNPTRVLQRVGRVNRVGTKFQQVHIFNFFPTEKAETQIGLEDNIKAKIHAFHSLLGEDAKYLTEEEEVASFEIFGDRLYRKLQDIQTYTGEAEQRSELEYLQIIRSVRDSQPGFFEQLKRLPRKARSGRVSLQHEKQGHLVTFIRKGQLKKFFAASEAETSEIPFLDAMELLRCEQEESRSPIPKQYFDLLAANKNAFDALVAEDEDDASHHSGSNNAQIIRRLKTPEIRHSQQYTEDDERFVLAVRQAFEDKRIPPKIAQRVNKALKTEPEPLGVLRILRESVPANFLIQDKSLEERRNQPREVVLSVYLT